MDFSRNIKQLNVFLCIKTRYYNYFGIAELLKNALLLSSALHLLFIVADKNLLFMSLIVFSKEIKLLRK